MPKQAETKIGEKIVDFLTDCMKAELPVYFEHRSGSGGFNYKKGVPDIWFTIKSIHVECEVKTDEGRLSTSQEKFRYRCLNFFHNRYMNPRSYEDFLKEFSALYKEIVGEGVPLLTN